MWWEAKVKQRREQELEQMEGCFGDTIQGFLQLEGAREDSKLQENISPTWNDQEARVAVN